MNINRDYDMSDFTGSSSEFLAANDVLEPRIVEIIDTYVDIDSVNNQTGGGKSKDTPNPVCIVLKGYEHKVWRPGVNTRRVLRGLYGSQPANYIGKKLRLYRDPNVTFGRNKSGGVRISHASGLKEEVYIPVTPSAGRSDNWKIEPLDRITREQVTREQIENCATLDELRELWAYATPELKEAITARAEQLQQNEVKGGGK